MHGGRCLIVALMLLLADSALACRCAQRPLAQYYAGAELVFIARAESVRGVEAPAPHRLVRFAIQGKPFKGDPSTLDHLATPESSATCGVPVEAGRLYLIFADRRAPGDTVAWFDTCNGSREFEPRGGDAQGFADVAAADVLPRLHALRAAAGGMDPRNAGTPRLPAADDATARIVGLLELPAKPLSVFAEPAADARRIAEVRGASDVLAKELSYEQPAALVRQQRPGWFRIALSEAASGWVRAEDTGAYRPVAALIVNRLNYLTTHWDGWVWPEPGAGYPAAATGRAAGGEQPANVLATQTIGGTLWLHVELLDRSPCEGEATRTLAGWIPAYSPEGELTAWFYSRGC